MTTLSATQRKILEMLNGCPGGATADMLALHHLFDHDALMALAKAELIVMRPTVLNDVRHTVHFRISDEGRAKVEPGRFRRGATRAWRAG
jgi:hypothetical protein